WNQKWRAVLREAFDELKEDVDAVYEAETSALVKDPWAARNDYIDVMLDDSKASRGRFLARHAKKTGNGESKKLWELLEAQKFALFMFTSCGWFFDDISGIEPVQVMKFALRAIELTRAYSKKDMLVKLLRSLERAKSNVPEMGTGADV